MAHASSVSKSNFTDILREYSAENILCDALSAEVGRGGFGTVLLAKHNTLGFLAVKCFVVSGGSKEQALFEKKIKNEFSTLLQFHHENIVYVYGFTKWPGAMGIVMQYYEGGNMRILLLDHYIPLGLSLRLRLATEISIGVAFIHNFAGRKSLVHGDLKPENILLTGDLHVKIADFGCAQMANYSRSTTMSIQGTGEKQAMTVFYAAPEKLLDFAKPKKEQDTYSCGLIKFMLLSREEPFQFVHNYQDFRKMLKRGMRPNCDAIEELKNSCGDIDREIVVKLEREMVRCWHQDPAHRPNMLEVRDELQLHLAKQNPAVTLQQVADAAKEMEIKHPSVTQNPTTPLMQFCPESRNFLNAGNLVSPAVVPSQMEEIPNVAPNQGGFPLLRSPQNETQQKSADISGVAQAFLPSVSDMTDPKLLVDPVQQSANDETPPKLPLDGDQQSSIDITNPKLLLDNQQNIVEDPALSSITNVKLPVDKDAQQLSGETSHETKLKLPLVYYGTLGHMTLPVGQSSSDRHERERMFKTEHNLQGSFSLENTKPKQAYQSRQKNLSTTESNDLSGFLVVGGSNSAQRNCVYYDVTTKRFQHLKKLNTGRCGAASVKIGSKVYVIGGAAHEWGGKTHQSCEMLELNEHAEWILLPDMLEARNDCRSGFIDGLIYVTGGFNNKGLSSCEAFDIQNNKWLRIKNMLHARYAHGLVVLNGSLYCIGGFDDKTPITSCERYDVRTGEWNEIASLSQPRHGLGSVVWGNKIYAIGGFSDNGRLATVERYHPEVDRWENGSQLQIARSYLSACVVKGTMYAVGGYNKENSNTVEVHDSTSDVWTIGFETEKQIRDATVVAI